VVAAAKPAKVAVNRAQSRMGMRSADPFLHTAKTGRRAALSAALAAGAVGTAAYAERGGSSYKGHWDRSKRS
jgi:hypothetical protein